MKHTSILSLGSAFAVVCLLAISIAFSPSLQSQETGASTPPPAREADYSTKVQITQINTESYPDVTVFFNVTRGGRPVTGLSGRNFLIKENGTEQVPTNIGVQLEPVTVVLLIDISGSMKSALRDAQAAAIEFLNFLYEEDEVIVMTFEEEVEVIYPRGNDLDAAAKAIADTRVKGDTALYDGIYGAVNELSGVSGRKMVIVLSDGIDDDGRGRQLSKNDFDKPLLEAMTNNIPIYTIGLGGNIDEGVLRAFGGATGAEYLSAPDKEELGQLYDRVGQQLAGQYAITYRAVEPEKGGIREVNLNLLIGSTKPFASPVPVMDPDGNVAAYRAPKLNDEEKAKLVQMTDLPKYAKRYQLSKLDRYLKQQKQLEEKWPESIPVFEGVKNAKFSKEGFEFSIDGNSKEASQQLAETLKKDGWKITNQSSAGKIHLVEAAKAGEKLSLAAVGGEDENKTSVTVEHTDPGNQPIRIERNGLDQIVEAHGREIVVSGSGCRLKILGRAARLTVTGNENWLQADMIEDLQISGSANFLNIATLGKAKLPGEKNTVVWTRGRGGSDPKVEKSGAGNEVSKLE